jgi:hypothetical protein
VYLKVDWTGQVEECRQCPCVCVLSPRRRQQGFGWARDPFCRSRLTQRQSTMSRPVEELEDELGKIWSLVGELAGALS